MPPYEGTFTPTFNACIQQCESNPQMKKRLKSVIDRILENPKVQSHLLRKEGGIDLRGKRRRHVSGNYVLVYAICDECINSGHQKFNNCGGCDGVAKNKVIFFAFDKWDKIYSKEWS